MNTRRISERAEKAFQAKPARTWPLHGVIGLQPSPLSLIYVALYPYRLPIYKLIDNRAASVTEQRKFKQLLD